MPSSSPGRPRLAVFVVVIASVAGSVGRARAVDAIRPPVADAVADVYVPVDPGDIHLVGGTLADRMKVNLEERLLQVDEKALTDGFTHRPGSHPWIGEHAGKFLHAAAWTYR